MLLKMLINEPEARKEYDEIGGDLFRRGRANFGQIVPLQIKKNTR